MRNVAFESLNIVFGCLAARRTGIHSWIFLTLPESASGRLFGLVDRVNELCESRAPGTSTGGRRVASHLP